MDDQEKRKKTMGYSIIDGISWSIMMNLGAVFLTPFAIAINAPLFFISALNSFPLLLDGIAQKIGSYFTDFGWGRKKVLVYGTVLQALTWLGIAILAFQFNILCSDFKNTIFILLVTTMYFLGGVVNPAWFALMGDVVHEQTRASWFGQRTRLMQIGALLALIFAGIFLDYMKTDIIFGFGVLFFIAFASRTIGAYYLNLHWDPKHEIKTEFKVGIDFAKYMICIFLIYFSINMAGIYTVVYRLKLLNFDYFWFAINAATFTIAYALASPHWGRLIEKYGTKKILSATSMLSFAMILPWIFVTNPIEALPAEIFSGIIFSGIAASTFNYLYEITNPRERIKAMGHFSLFLGAGIFVGVIAGGAILGFLGENVIYSFHILFIIAALVRLLSGFFVVLNTKEIKIPLKKATTFELMAKIVTIYPFQGLAYDLNKVILSTKSAKKK